jgi:hypothetical protein
LSAAICFFLRLSAYKFGLGAILSALK